MHRGSAPDIKGSGAALDFSRTGKSPNDHSDTREPVDFGGALRVFGSVCLALVALVCIVPVVVIVAGIRGEADRLTSGFSRLQRVV